MVDIWNMDIHHYIFMHFCVIMAYRKFRTDTGPCAGLAVTVLNAGGVQDDIYIDSGAVKGILYG